MSNPNLYGRLGTRTDVQKRLAEAVKLALSGFDLDIQEDEDAQTASITTEQGRVTVFEALHKGGGVWLCLYNETFYPKPQ